MTEPTTKQVVPGLSDAGGQTVSSAVRLPSKVPPGKKAYAYWMITVPADALGNVVSDVPKCPVCWAIAEKGPYTDENPLPPLPAHKGCTCSVEIRFEDEEDGPK